MKSNIKIIVPICRPLHNMDDVSAFDGKQFEFNNSDITGTFTIHYHEEYNNSLIEDFFSMQEFVNYSFWYGRNLEYHYLEFVFTITRINEEKSKENETLSEKDWNSLLLSVTISFCEDEYKMFVFAFFLSFPIPTTFERGIILMDNNAFSYTDKYRNSFDTEENNWIDFYKCWNYLHDISKFKFGLSQNNASRFISILSKLNESEEDIISSIFYASMALEAVYARGTSEGISRQIIDKVKIFLNKDIDEKKLSKIYGIRSRYIHGDTEIQLAFLDFCVDKKDELYELLSYICEILYNTAKRIIEENISTIDFDYTVRLS